MSEYYLADQRARERAKRDEPEGELSSASHGQDIKATLLGDFVFPASEPSGFDPYNSVHGTSPRDTWRGTRARR